ncbi:putative vacuolar membrane transporter for cationic amino acids [Lecanora helva]
MSSSAGLNIDIEALSGICGSISIACWVVVFSPQIIENFRRSSAEGLSLVFIVVWLLGDVFNILGAVLQGVLPTMIILAIYYTLADMVLLGQCFYYRGFTLSDEPVGKSVPVADEEAVEEVEPTEQSALLPHKRPTISDADFPSARGSSRGSFSSLRSRLSSSNVDATHLSPATPFIPPPKPTDTPPAVSSKKARSSLATFFLNTGALVVVCAAGVLGWWLSSRSTHRQHPQNHRHGHDRHSSPTTEDSAEPLRFDLWGQIFGYLCAVLYLGSRIPQLLLNYRRKSTEGVSMLFFLFACLGNLTYVMSIFAYEPPCAKIALLDNPRQAGFCEEGEWSRGYGQYILLNTSWLIGSAGTLILDLMIFAQFWIYRERSSQET